MRPYALRFCSSWSALRKYVSANCAALTFDSSRFLSAAVFPLSTICSRSEPSCVSRHAMCSRAEPPMLALSVISEYFHPTPERFQPRIRTDTDHAITLLDPQTVTVTDVVLGWVGVLRVLLPRSSSSIARVLSELCAILQKLPSLARNRCGSQSLSHKALGFGLPGGEISLEARAAMDPSCHDVCGRSNTAFCVGGMHVTNRDRRS